MGCDESVEIMESCLPPRIDPETGRMMKLVRIPGLPRDEDPWRMVFVDGIEDDV